MPLLKRLPFRRQKPPENLDPEQEVFHCKLTNEIFTDYEEFFQRMILCNSLVWTCELTGRPGLTYQEAKESEQRCKESLISFPTCLKGTILFLASLTRRGRLADMCDDVFVFARDRFFIGEEVECVANEIREQCVVIGVIPPNQNIHSSDYTYRVNGELNKTLEVGLDPHLYKYKVTKVGSTDAVCRVYSSNAVSRKRGSYTRERSKLFLKQACTVNNSIWGVREDIAEKYKLDGMQFVDIFAGPLPTFACSPAKSRGRPSITMEKKEHKGKKRERECDNAGREAKERKVSVGVVPAEYNVEVKQENYAVNEEDIAAIEEVRKKMEEDRIRKKEELKLKVQEEKQRKREERDKIREERRLKAQKLREWQRPRDDLECDDLKPLPQPTPVHCQIPNDLFGDAVMVLEFMGTFHELLSVGEQFPNGFTFDMLEKALIDKDIHGPLCDILQFLLKAIFSFQEQEEDDEQTREETDFSKELPDFGSAIGRSRTDIIQEASLAAAMPQACLGVPLSRITLDAFTLTEVLRLHLLSSGAPTSQASARWRYQQRGGYAYWDDPGFQLHIDHPELIDKLVTHFIYDLTIDEKIKILKVLLDQLLTYVPIRDHIEDNLERLKLGRIELKQLQWAEQRREKEEYALKWKKHMEERLKTKLDEDPSTPIPTSPEKRRRGRPTKKEAEERENEKMSSPQSSPSKRKRGRPSKLEVEIREKLLGESIGSEQEMIDVTTPEENKPKKRGRKKKIKLELQDTSSPLENGEGDKNSPEVDKKEIKRKKFYIKRENELLESVIALQEKCLVVTLGRDRGYRRYWVFKTVGGLFVEDDDEFVGTCLVRPTVQTLNASSETEHNHNKENDISHAVKEIGMDNINKSHNLLGDTNIRMNGISSLVLSEDKIKEEPIEIVDKLELKDIVSETSSTVTVKQEEVFGLCSADVNTCNIHGPSKSGARWCFFSDPANLDVLMDGLNPRGFRESALKETLLSEADKIKESISSCPVKKLTVCDEKKFSVQSENNLSMELTLRDMILEMEEKIQFGGLGSVKVPCRQTWRNKIEKRGPSSQQNGLEEEGLQSHVVKDLAAALVQIAEGIDPKFLNQPLGEDEETKRLRLHPVVEPSIDPVQAPLDNEDQIARSPLERWSESLLSSSSISQVFLHLTALEQCVAWSRSLLNASCRMCRRKRDPESMLMCDGCNRGHHLYCLKPPLKSVPEGDWLCHTCKPKEKKKTFVNRRRVFSEMESDEENVDESGGIDVEADEDVESVSSNEPEPSECRGCLEEGGPLVACEACPALYHIYCLEPPMKRMPRKSWRCPECSESVSSTSNTPISFSGKKVKYEEDSEDSSTKPIKKKSKYDDDTEEYSPKLIKKGTKIKKRNDSGSEESSSPIQIPRGKQKVTENGDAHTETSQAKKNKRHSLEDEELYYPPRPSFKVRRGPSGDVPLDFNLCDSILTELSRDAEAWPFLRPVSKKQCPDYFDIIKKPMDFGTMRTKLNNTRYNGIGEFLLDFIQMFQNCSLYNRKGSPVHTAGLNLTVVFYKLLQKNQLDKLPDVEPFFNKRKHQLGLDGTAKKSRKTL